jgi:eukaryotic-like serine/threonine-protein kinase
VPAGALPGHGTGYNIPAFLDGSTRVPPGRLMLRRRTPWWVFACAATFVAFFGLLVYCDAVRPESEGVDLAFTDALTVKAVHPGSAASRAGLRPGDRIVAVDGQPIGPQKMDWVAVATNVEFDKPIALDIRRDGAALRVRLEFHRESLSRWTTREGLDLIGVRLVQFVTLCLALLLVFRRPEDPVARLGAWLLGSVSVFCVVLPFRISAVWRGLWWPAGLLLWLPFASALLLGALLLTFFLFFPVRRVRRRGVLVALWAPLLATATPFLRFQVAAVYTPDRCLALWDGFTLLLGVSMCYLAATAGVAVWSYRRLADANERRRLRVLLAGAVVGCTAAGSIVFAWWRGGTLALFGARSMGWMLPLLVVVPVSFVYAVLRHRLFDLRLIVRRGVQYALARRLLLSLVPALLVAMAFDLYRHRDQPMVEVAATRATGYLLLSAVAVLAQSRRQRWLEALDRRFFRERYDAQRILRRVSDDIRGEGSLERVAGRVVTQIELALHPAFVVLLVRPAGAELFRPLAAAPPGGGPSELPSGGTLVAIARVLGRPLEVSARGTGTLGERLPDDEIRAVRAMGLDLLVPIVADAQGPEALLALGARRSEEPYAREDEDLLQTLATTLGLLVAREIGAAGPEASFGECSRCGACYDETTTRCDADGSSLSVVRFPRVLAARYRVESRLGRGGMGTVYSAADLALQRNVAVKVLRDDLAGDPEAVRRFEAEARTAAGFSHPHVVTIHDYGVTPRGRAFLVMEQLEGRTLRAEMDGAGALPPARVMAILRGVCSAVDAAHRRRLVHRDLKPENVFLSLVEGAEIPKVLDFGIAKRQPVAAPGDGRATSIGVVLGTPAYMAPEQLRGEAVSSAWDVWALAVMAHEMLTGCHPFESFVVARPGSALPAAPGPAAAARLSQVDARLPVVFEAALGLDASRRPATAGALCASLEQALST